MAPKATRVCFSYKSVRGVPPPHVSAAKQQLEDLGYRVKWGLDVSRTAADWRNVWMRWCEEADFVVNFLSVDYVKKGTGEACADEWCIGQKKKRPEQLINLVIGGRDARKAIENLPAAGLADGASQIQIYLAS